MNSVLIFQMSLQHSFVAVGIDCMVTIELTHYVLVGLGPLCLVESLAPASFGVSSSILGVMVSIGRSRKGRVDPKYSGYFRSETLRAIQ